MAKTIRFEQSENQRLETPVVLLGLIARDQTTRFTGGYDLYLITKIILFTKIIKHRYNCLGMRKIPF